LMVDVLCLWDSIISCEARTPGTNEKVGRDWYLLL
jgi:hypothetical protein